MSGILRRTGIGKTMFWCPGCECAHGITDAWGITSGPKPSITPSVLVLGAVRCHLFVRDGNIQFLADCDHALAGQTVPMVEMPG